MDDGTRTPLRKFADLYSPAPRFYLWPAGIILESIPVVLTGPAQYRTLKKNGVDDGTRTHDDRDHNPGLYQLSYAHHGNSNCTAAFAAIAVPQWYWIARQDSNLQPSA